jgi:hypothetical protein
MNKETIKKLTKPFPKSVVQKAPQGKYGDYVPHHIYTQRLVDVVGGEYNFRIKEIIRDKDNAVVGAICRLEINGLGVVEEVGDVDAHAIKRNITESEVLKLAVSDGIKRCCMRFGIGLELWTGGVSEEEHYAGETPKEVVVKEEPKKKLIAQEEQTSPSSITEPQIKEMVFTMCNEDKQFAKKCYETTMTRIKMDKNVSDNVGDWSNDTVDINNTLDILDAKIVEKKEQEDMADIPEGKWMEDPISDGQKNFINSLIEQCIDAGLDELGAEGKSYLNGGSATKGNASAMIDKLKSALS